MEGVASRLLAHYQGAAQRMRELPFFNPALAVELVGWQPLQAETPSGVLITPWCLDLIWVPLNQALPRKGETVCLTLGEDVYEGTLAWIEPDLYYASAPLVSDTRVLVDQTAARALAEEVMALLLASRDAASTGVQVENPARRALFRRAFGGER